MTLSLMSLMLMLMLTVNKNMITVQIPMISFPLMIVTTPLHDLIGNMTTTPHQIGNDDGFQEPSMAT
jgi:hypothetical protein